jgi:hypothetical protein
MKDIILFLSCFIMANVAFSQKVSYFFSAEYSYRDLKIDNMNITYTTIDEEKMSKKNTNPIAQVPQWDTSCLVTKKAKLTEAEQKTLIQLVSNFMTLDKSEYGEVKDEDRHYSYTIEVLHNNKNKKVVYKSSPDSKPRPDAFKQLEDFILQLINNKFKSNKK